MKVNPNNFNQEALEARELRERKSVQQHRACRRMAHRSTRTLAPFVCPDCGGDCKALAAGISASMAQAAKQRANGLADYSTQVEHQMGRSSEDM
jgi:hypothetical protein